MRPHHWALILSMGVIVGAGAAPAVADEAIGQVRAYKGSNIRVYSAEGQPGERVAVSSLPRPPADIVAARPGGLIGVRGPNGSVVYLRGIDLEFRLDQGGAVVCAPASAPGRRADTAVPGVSAGAGSTRDCRPAE